MNVLDFQSELTAYAASIGVDKIGYTTAAPFHELRNRLIRQQELGYASGFEEPDVELRTNPLLLLEEAQSIVSIAIAYPSKLRNAPQGKQGSRRGLFCRASWGTDYHAVVKDKLALLEAFIQRGLPGAKTRSMVDTGELSDRAVAERSGLGWSAKNCMIITPEFGSYVYLGELITTVPFAPDEAIDEQCGECRLCLDRCPTGALVGPGQLNAQRCISFLTQTKTVLPDEFRPLIGNRLYGCDTCQTVCPKNKGKANLHQPDFRPDPELVKPLLLPLLSMTNRQFKDVYGHMSGAWRGRTPIQRNAILALVHFKEEGAAPEFRRLLESDPRPVIRATAAWALGKVGAVEEAEQSLGCALAEESEAIVREEIQKGLAILHERKEALH